MRDVEALTFCCDMMKLVLPGSYCRADCSGAGLERFGPAAVCGCWSWRCVYVCVCALALMVCWYGSRRRATVCRRGAVCGVVLSGAHELLMYVRILLCAALYFLVVGGLGLCRSAS